MRLTKAFTLSEILIALTIVGIIAVLTVPTLVTDTSSSAFKTKFKSTFVQIQNGLIHAENVQKHSFVDVGEVGNFDAKYTLNQFMQHHFSATQVARSDYSGAAVYKLKNGAHIIFPKDAQETMKKTGCTNSEPCMVIIDINGNSGPNEEIWCTTEDTKWWPTANYLSAACTVDDKTVSDIYSILIKKSHIYPASNATNVVLSK